MRKILTAAFVAAVMICLCGCEPPEKEETTTTTATTTATTTTTSAVTTASETEEQTVSETTTGKVGGFIVYEEAPGADIEWEEIGEE